MSTSRVFEMKCGKNKMKRWQKPIRSSARPGSAAKTYRFEHSVCNCTRFILKTAGVNH